MTPRELQSQRAVADILSSIRQMISEDEKQKENLEPSVASQVRPSSSSLKKNVLAEGILELTRLVEKDGSIIDLARKEQKAGEEKNIRPLKAAPELLLKTPQEVLPPHREGVQVFLKSAPLEEEEKSFKKEDKASARPRSQQGWSEVSRVSSLAARLPQEALLSEEALQKAALAFADLSHVHQHSSSPSHEKTDVPETGSYTVDNLMRELLRPLLKEWLDAQLPSLVRELVAEQVEKVSRVSAESYDRQREDYKSSASF